MRNTDQNGSKTDKENGFNKTGLSKKIIEKLNSQHQGLRKSQISSAAATSKEWMSNSYKSSVMPSDLRKPKV